jgi:hypothetical protein
MIDLKHPMCIKCKIKRPYFGFADRKRIYCRDCKIDGMINLKTPMCIKCNKIYPTFGLLGGKKEYCFTCKSDEMINLQNKTNKQNMNQENKIQKQNGDVDKFLNMEYILSEYS